MFKTIIIMISCHLLTSTSAKPLHDFFDFRNLNVTSDLSTMDRIILPQIRELSSEGSYDDSSSFDPSNDLVYGPEFLFNPRFFIGKRNLFGPNFPFAADYSFDTIDPGFDTEKYQHKRFDSSTGYANEFNGGLSSFFNGIYGGFFPPKEDRFRTDRNYDGVVMKIVRGPYLIEI